MLNRVQKISPFLWFNNNAEEAVDFYTTVFKNSSIGQKARYGEAGAKVSGQPQGSVMTVPFELEGQPFTALNGGPEFKFTHAVSFVINCDTQEEIDYYWEALSKGGETEPCGWLRDQFGVSWQVVPSLLGELMKDNAERSERVMEALLKMKKIDLATLREAHDSVKQRSKEVTA